MKATRRQRRDADRRLGRRALDRRARRLTVRVLELDAEGFGPSAIASTTGLSLETVTGALNVREEEEEAS